MMFVIKWLTFDVNGVELCDEPSQLCNTLPFWKCFAAHTVLDINIKACFSNVWVALQILLALPVTVARSECSFSKLKLTKT